MPLFYNVSNVYSVDLVWEVSQCCLPKRKITCFCSSQLYWAKDYETALIDQFILLCTQYEPVASLLDDLLDGPCDVCRESLTTLSKLEGFKGMEDFATALQHLSEWRVAREECHGFKGDIFITDWPIRVRHYLRWKDEACYDAWFDCSLENKKGHMLCWPINPLNLYNVLNSFTVKRPKKMLFLGTDQS